MSIRRYRAIALLLAAATWIAGGAWAADPLGRFPVDPAEVSVSGISSGAFMANQLHIAHSAGIVGAGMIAGGLYGCAVHPGAGGGMYRRGPLWRRGGRVSEDGGLALASLAIGPCMSVPTLLRPVDFYAQLTGELAAKGWIDPPGDLARSRVYLFTGQADKIVSSKTVELGASLYRALGVPAAQVKFRDRD